ncbi:hypothetical protein HMN09_01353500 [Mycena chlorophos]|uniref:ZZ-type domain-containing protein n=1 Tax=Mycena chlorophos TaxID=658473 RepID=A0A8H6VT35_MYCCL|nr:hypothetical protein HMN09_01353500 [Mycena chlorophos]
MPILPKIFRRGRSSSTSASGGADAQAALSLAASRSSASSTGSSHLQLLPLLIPDEPSEQPANTSSNVSPAPSIMPTTEAEDGHELDAVWPEREGQAGFNSGTEEEMPVVDEANNVAAVVADTSSAADDPLFSSREAERRETTILEGVPAAISALEALREVHPFLTAAYLPFKLVYIQESQRRDDDQKRTELFRNVKDAMLVLLELKNFPNDDSPATPDGQHVLSRVAQVCKDMKSDIEECCNVLDAREKRSFGPKLLKAAAWNKELAEYATRFMTRREELRFALGLRTAVTADEIETNMKNTIQLFATMLSPEEQHMLRWIEQNGGEQAVTESNIKCAALIALGESLVSGSSVVDDELAAIAALRREYQEDIQFVIQENLEAYSKRFAIGLDELAQSLGQQVQHQGDRPINYLQAGSHSRIKDKIVYHIWKVQGWKGSARTQQLVFSIVEYFVQRTEGTTRGISAVEEDEDQDPEMHGPLPDDWVLGYLSPHNLKNLYNILDPHSSGFTTISEINAFTSARPPSFPRWFCYNAVGRAQAAARYSLAIKDIWVQMHGVRREVWLRMPGNTRYINEYIDATWPSVAALMSSDAVDPFLQEKFIGYQQLQEARIREKLEEIRYCIDIEDDNAVAFIVGNERIEDVIFVILTLLLRRHLLKMCVAYERELDRRELDEDAKGLLWVIMALWRRFRDIEDELQQQGVKDLKAAFETIANGLFDRYLEWGTTYSPEYYIKNDCAPWVSTYVSVLPMRNRTELSGLLSYDGSEIPRGLGDSQPITTPLNESSTLPNSPVEESRLESSPLTSQELAIAGVWYGWYWSVADQPSRLMMQLNLMCGKRTLQTGMGLHGSGELPDGQSWTGHGQLGGEDLDQAEGIYPIYLVCSFPLRGITVSHDGTYDASREMISGSFRGDWGEGEFLFKKVEDPVVLCSRPLVPVLDAKQLWSYACNAVLDRIREEKPGFLRVFRRLVDLRRLVVLTHRHSQGTLADVDRAEYSQILKTFTSERARYFGNICSWYERGANLHSGPGPNMRCANCESEIGYSRVVCLECISTDPEWPERTLDLCTKLDCLLAEEVEDHPHSSSHILFKTRDFFFYHFWANFLSRAQSQVVSARSEYAAASAYKLGCATALPAEDDHVISRVDEAELLLSRAVTPDGTSRGLPPSCNLCHEAIVLPGWYCWQCTDTWVCHRCETTFDDLEPWDLIARYRQHDATPSTSHRLSHPLIWISSEPEVATDLDQPQMGREGPPDEPASPQAWDAVERRLEALVNKRFESVERRLDGFESKLTNIERLLATLVQQQSIAP